MTPLAYLPQHIAQIAGIALGIYCVGFGVLVLVKGVPAEMRGRLSPELSRLIAPIAILLGVGIGAVFFFVDAEGPYSSEGDHWGGVWGVSILLVWLAVLGGVTVYNLRKFRKAERRPRGTRTRRP